MDYTLTQEDLEVCLAGLEKSANHYRANKILHKNDPEQIAYADKMLKKLDIMAVEAIARYYNQ